MCCSADEAVLWLWTVHNRVNKRLQSDITTDPEHPKIQFPAAGMCQACWTTHRGKEHSIDMHLSFVFSGTKYT